MTSFRYRVSASKLFTCVNMVEKVEVYRYTLMHSIILSVQSVHVDLCVLVAGYRRNIHWCRDGNRTSYRWLSICGRYTQQQKKRETLLLLN